MARAEMLDGGAGEDTLSGEAGSDVLFGGAGNDIFTSSASAFNLDTISDFAVGDSIVVTGADLSALNGEAASGPIDLGSGLELTLAGITAASRPFPSSFRGGPSTEDALVGNKCFSTCSLRSSPVN